MKKYALYVLVAAGYTFRFLTGNLYGVLILLTILYFLLEPVFGVSPLTPIELLAVVDSFDMDQKALLLSSGLTILGFMIAFSVATKSWKQQTQASLRLQAAKEIHDTYSPIATVIIDIQIFAKSLIKIADKIEKNERVTDFDLEYALSQYERCRSDQHFFRTAHRQSYSLLGIYSHQLFAAGNSWEKLQELGEELSKLSETLSFSLPFIYPNERNREQIFISSIQREKIEKFIKDSDSVYDKVNGLSGLIRGRLTTPLMEHNLSMFKNFMKHGLTFFRLADEVLNKPKSTEQSARHNADKSAS